MRSLEPRERRTIIGGATIVAVAALLVLVIIPQAGRWRAREAVIEQLRMRIGQVNGLIANESAIVARADSIDAALAAAPVQLLRARSAALAASAIQSLVRDVALESHVSIDRLDVAGEPDTSRGATVIVPASVTAWGDIYGVAEYLRRLQHGRHLMAVDDLSLAPNPTRRGNLLQVSLTLRVPVALEP